MPIWLGGKINAANRRINERTPPQSRATRRATPSSPSWWSVTSALRSPCRSSRCAGRSWTACAAATSKTPYPRKNGMIAQSERLYVEFKMAEAERELANAPSCRPKPPAHSQHAGTRKRMAARDVDVHDRQGRGSGLLSGSRRTATAAQSGFAQTPAGRGGPRPAPTSCRRWPSAAARSATIGFRASCPLVPWAWESISRSSTA